MTDWIHILAALTLFFAGVRFVIACVNLLETKALHPVDSEGAGTVSVLIPARNEAENLPSLLDGLSRQTLSPLEILVYDDQSTDGTVGLAMSFQAVLPGLKVLKGLELPQGWLGKNHACHQLAGQARGDYFLFLDADVTLAPAAIESAIARLRRNQAGLLSVFPTQEMRSTGEWLTVPLMNWILLSLLPLRLVYRSSMPSLAAANGQFMLFRAEDYRAGMWHEQVKGHPVEDIRIIKAMKRQGMKTDVTLGSDQVYCRMYQGFREAVAGYAKNVVHFFGGSYTMLFLFVVFTTFTPLSLLMYPSVYAGVALPAWLVFVILTKSFTSLASRQSLARNLLMHPFQIGSLSVIGFRAFWHRRGRNLKWKGRSIGHE